MIAVPLNAVACERKRPASSDGITGSSLHSRVSVLALRTPSGLSPAQDHTSSYSDHPLQDTQISPAKGTSASKHKSPLGTFHQPPPRPHLSSPPPISPPQMPCMRPSPLAFRHAPERRQKATTARSMSSTHVPRNKRLHKGGGSLSLVSVSPRNAPAAFATYKKKRQKQENTSLRYTHVVCSTELLPTPSPTAGENKR